MYQFHKTLDDIIATELSVGTGLNVMVDRFREVVISETLAKVGHNQCAAARELKIHRNTLVRWINKLGLRE
jgi:transcriptional regulator with PAS, ATPase and Fis domain